MIPSRVAPLCLLLLAGACSGGGDSNDSSPPTTTPSPVLTHTTAVSVRALDNNLEPTELVIGPGEIVEFTFTNQGAAAHNMHIADPSTGRFSEDFCEGLTDPCLDPSLVRSGEFARLLWQAPEDPIEIPFRCDFHPQEMTGTIIIE